LRRGHRRLGGQQQAVDAPDGGTLDDGGDECPAGAAVLLLGRHGQRPDFCFAGTAGDLAEAVERLEHDCSDDAPVLLRDQHLTGAGYAKPAQDFRVAGVCRKQLARPVCGDPQLTDPGQLAGPGIPHDHIASSPVPMPGLPARRALPPVATRRDPVPARPCRA